MKPGPHSESDAGSRAMKIVFVGLLIAALMTWALAWARLRHAAEVTDEPAAASERAARTLAERCAALVAHEAAMDTTVWAPEILAQQCGRAFESLWDSINAATNKLAVASRFSAREIMLGQWDRWLPLPHGVEQCRSAGRGPTLSNPAWRRLVEDCEGSGWQLAQVEFRHRRFETGPAGLPRASRYSFSAHLLRPGRSERAVLEGELGVEWVAERPGERPPAIARVDASGLTITRRRGPPPFQPLFEALLTPPRPGQPIDPLLVYDLDHDGLAEILLPAKNLLYHRGGPDAYTATPLFQAPPELADAAVVADFDGDGQADLLCAANQGLLLFAGSPAGAFDRPGRLVWQAKPPLRNPTVLTCGDMDHDGDLDVFLGQYRMPTLGQPILPHFYDSNDGFPAFLLENHGRGEFTDVTLEAGLAAKRHRRTYSASWVDLNDDGHLDLLVVSDFAGLDLHQNLGNGRFADVTSQWLEETRAFGMAHCLADFDRDGRLDLLMLGMDSATVDRLEHLGLWRPGGKEDQTMRWRMNAGNRLYFARTGGGFEPKPPSQFLARSGWSWGASAFDFDNDGFPDVYVANGHQSKATVRDYEGEFWLHDVFVAEQADEVAASAYFVAKYNRTRGQGWSYGGFDKNRLFLNQGGAAFLEAGHLMGVALEQDSRNVVTEDLDGDGRVDLLVTTIESWPDVPQTLRVYRNTLEDAGPWIGFRFREEPRGLSPAGARVILHGNSSDQVRVLVTGDSHRSQHANTVHFGLGASSRVDRAEIRWVGGQTITLPSPALNRYHDIQAPKRSDTQ